MLNLATPTIPTTEPLHVESGSLDNSENTDTSKNLMSEPSVSIPDTQSIPMEEWPQTQNASVIKDPSPDLQLMRLTLLHHQKELKV